MIGELVGNFRVIRRLGQGGMGEVLLAEHKEIHTKVAIKLLLPHISADKQHVQRFFNEAVAVSKIKHAGIAKIFDVGFLPRGDAYLVMEFLDGESLASRIRRAGRLPFDQVSDIARQIASVLEATHAEGITHRDLKPDNIFLIPDAELATGERVKVLDFGIAKLGASSLTQTGGAMGTPGYMSPEQWKSSAKVDGRADLYSLGCLVFEMACGRAPFMFDSIGELCQAHLNEQAPTARSVVPDLPPAFDAFVTRLLAKQADERPSVREAKISFASFAKDFAGVCAPTVAPDAMPPLAEYAVKRLDPPQPTTLGGSAIAVATPQAPRRRRPLVAALAGALVVAGGAAFALSRRAGAPVAAQPTAAPPAASTPSVAAVPSSSPPSPPPPGGADRESVTSRVHIETVPPAAEVTIDDARVGNPFDGRFARSDVRHKVEVRAPGHKPDSRWVTFDSDATLVITLDSEPGSRRTSVRAARPAPAPAATPAPAAAQAAPAVTPPAGKPTYKGTKGTIITEYPPD